MSLKPKKKKSPGHPNLRPLLNHLQLPNHPNHANLPKIKSAQPDLPLVSNFYLFDARLNTLTGSSEPGRIPHLHLSRIYASADFARKIVIEETDINYRMHFL